MTDLDPAVPTVAFLITDALPHLQTDRGSTEAQHELNYLVSRGVSQDDAQDVFKTFQNITLAHFGGNLILNAVVFNSGGYYANQPSGDQLLFGSFAQQIGGMLMQPDSRNSAVLAQGLVTVVQSLLERLVGHGPAEAGAQPEATEQLQGFKLIDLSGVTADRASEQEDGGAVKYGDADVIFNIALDRMVAGRHAAPAGQHTTASGRSMPFKQKVPKPCDLIISVEFHHLHVEVMNRVCGGSQGGHTAACHCACPLPDQLSGAAPDNQQWVVVHGAQWLGVSRVFFTCTRHACQATYMGSSSDPPPVHRQHSQAAIYCCSCCMPVCGKKWSKRAIGMTAPGEQLQFVWRAARYISLCTQAAPAGPEQAAQLSKSKADELDRLLKLRETIVEALPESAAGHFSINEQSLKQMAEEAAAWGNSEGGGAAAVSAISLESVGDALEVGV